MFAPAALFVHVVAKFIAVDFAGVRAKTHRHPPFDGEGFLTIRFHAPNEIFCIRVHDASSTLKDACWDEFTVALLVLILSSYIVLKNV